MAHVAFMTGIASVWGALDSVKTGQMNRMRLVVRRHDTRRKTELRSPFSCQGTCFYASISTPPNTKMHKNAIFLRVDLQMCICFRNFVGDFNRAHRAK